MEEKIDTFILKKKVELPELQCVMRQLEDEETGAQVLHIEADDEENVFCLSFQTLPPSSNGVAHILEHTVLCGSKKYPVKDAFFLMNRRSLNTFMNAFTGSDFTCYPAASQVENDFYNLLDVYLDSVFHPNLNRLSFLQEGHRVEFEKAEDPHSDLLFKGVVYNEMKGALSSGNSRLLEEVSKHLFHGLPYEYNSGGNPKEIPDLTYEEFLDFHQTYYHPGRCLFYFYGNIPLEKHLKFIREKVLKGVKRPKALPAIPKTIRMEAPKKVQIPYPISQQEELEGKSLICFSWLTCDLKEQLEALALSVLLVALVDTDASPLKMALLKSKLCKRVMGSIDVEVAEVPILLTMEGCNPEHLEPLEQTLASILQEIANKPLDKELIEGSIHQIEIQRSEITGDYLPYGLVLFLRAGLLEHHKGEPEEALKIHSLFNTLRQNYEEDPLYFNKLLEKWLIKNPHQVEVLCYPDKELEAKEALEEKELLKKIKEKLSPNQVELVINDAESLRNYQDGEEDGEECLPKVTLADVSKKTRDYPLIIENAKNLDIYTHTCFTNNLLYADVTFDIPNTPLEDLPYLQMFSTLLTQLGAEYDSYQEMPKKMQIYTGGIYAAISLNQLATDPNQFRPKFHVQGKALKRNTPQFFELMQKYIRSPDFLNRERIKEVILKQFTAIQNRLSQSALSYGAGLAAKGHTVPNEIAYHLWGLEYYWNLKEWVNDLDNAVEKIIEKCNQFYQQIFTQKPDLILSCDQEQKKFIQENGYFGLGEWEQNTVKGWDTSKKPEKLLSQGRIISGAVAYCYKLIPTVSYNDLACSHLSLASHILDNRTLHKEIRERGGAYGGGSGNKPRSAYFSFYSYRDPQIARTLEVFEEACQKVIDKGVKTSHLEEAKLESIQDLDNPVSPGSRAAVAYAWHIQGKTLDLRQQWRDAILGATKDQVKQAVGKHLDPKNCKSTTVVMASKEIFDKENPLIEEKGKKPLPLFSIESRDGV